MCSRAIGTSVVRGLNDSNSSRRTDHRQVQDFQKYSETRISVSRDTRDALHE
jgi:hypothetical protein